MTATIAIILAVICVFISVKTLLLLGVLLIISLVFKRSKLVVFFSLTLVAGVFFWFADSQNRSQHEAGALEAVVTLSDGIVIDGDAFRAQVVYQDERFQLSYKITSEQEQQALKKLKYGDQLHVNAELEAPEKNRNQDQFNYQAFLYRKHIHWLLKANMIQPVTSKSTTWLHTLKNFRKNQLEKIDAEMDNKISPYVASLVYGDRSYVDTSVYESYQRLGVVHLLAISGLHVNLIVAGFLLVLRRLGFQIEKTAIMMICLLPLYCLMTGGNAPVVRAAIMTICLMAGRLSPVRVTSLQALCFSFIFVFLFNPYCVFEIGFQLSYAVSFAIILSGRKIMRKTSSTLLNSLYISLISTVSGIAIMSYHFYEFSIVGVFLNIVYVPLFTFILLPLSFLAIFFMNLMPIMLTIPATMMKVAVTVSEALATLLQKIPFTTWITGRPSNISLLLLIMLTFFFFYKWEKTGKAYRYLIPVCICLFLGTFNFTGKVSFIDVGQGDSVLIQLPWNKGNYVIDVGGQMAFEKEQWAERKEPFSVGKNIVTPVLKANGISTLDKLIVTHSDADHMEGLIDVGGAMHIKELVYAEGGETKSIMQKALKALPKIPRKAVLAGYSWMKGDAAFQVISPIQKGEGGNNDSIVITAVLDNKRWLFTGDIEKETELALLENPLIKADILKVAHHGSKTSTTPAFIEQVKPTISIISCGLNNRFGHPREETLETLEKANTTIYRTDLQGEIIYTFSKGFTFGLE
ncbi:DNA internalization-related competence protein ComEC/Rec2 [Listeria grandensis]|uniref:DNA internalization-related competence protein ComEC/Rec2 n=1 Tax=Listeria grandensis TaxID=1494963 RepID=UPI00164D9FC0|nr:DNA internalization-related competence protein ComEC/Rec2 [Listeria grandensis]MBC6315372.1 DNA internalization-related competence protein ComEC/Rec2 [Listeria grandensis]